MTVHLDNLEDTVDFILQRIPQVFRMGAPLGIGKPHRLLNALYERIESDRSRQWHLYTALSLDPPAPGSGLQARFVGEFVERHFGADFPRLHYVQAMKRDALPAHIQVEEFYLQSGALMHSSQTQRRYASLNYTHVARATIASTESWVRSLLHDSDNRRPPPGSRATFWMMMLTPRSASARATWV